MNFDATLPIARKRKGFVDLRKRKSRRQDPFFPTSVLSKAILAATWMLTVTLA